MFVGYLAPVGFNFDSLVCIFKGFSVFLQGSVRRRPVAVQYKIGWIILYSFCVMCDRLCMIPDGERCVSQIFLLGSL